MNIKNNEFFYKNQLSTLNKEIDVILKNKREKLEEEFKGIEIDFSYDLAQDRKEKDNSLLITKLTQFQYNLNLFYFFVKIKTSSNNKDVDKLKETILKDNFFKLATIEFNNEMIDVKEEVIRDLEQIYINNFYYDIFTNFNKFNLIKQIEKKAKPIIVCIEYSILSRSSETKRAIEEIKEKYENDVVIYINKYPVVFHSELKEEYSVISFENLLPDKNLNDKTRAILFSDILETNISNDLINKINKKVSQDNEGFFLNWLK